jgi:mannose-1-phosphate guanylyltransferase
MRVARTTQRNGTSELSIPQAEESKYAAVILAGGDGYRLSSFTRKIFGYHLPKQLCPLFEGETLLDRTMRRTSIVVPPAQTVMVLNRAHERFYSPLLANCAPIRPIIQPENRGTAPAILCALLNLIENGHKGPVAIFPSDHYVSDDFVFMRHVSDALRAAELAPELVVLLGITPDGPETEYGWIEPGPPVAASHHPLGQINQVRRFWEKPSLDMARDLYSRNYLWNSFIFVGNALNLLSLIVTALPEMFRPFRGLEAFTGSASEEVLQNIFRTLPSLDFSRSVLAEFPTEFSVLPVTGVTWSDLGEPRRLLAAISSGGDRHFGGNQNVPKSQSFADSHHQQQISQHKAPQDQR